MHMRILYALSAAALALSAAAPAQTASNVALGKSATASSPADPAVARLATDGDLNSRWESAQIDEVDWTVDLGKTYTDISEVQILWEGAFTQDFDLQVSDDGEDFTTVREVRGQKLEGFPNEQKYDMGGAAGRYVRFHGLKRGTAWGNSFYEFRVMSSMFDPDINLAKGKPATAGINPENAWMSNNSDINQRWGSSGEGKDDYANQWWQVDLGAAYDVSKVVIFWEGAYAIDYVIEGRVKDSGDWTLLTTVSDETPKVGNTPEFATELTFAAKPARYVRIRSSRNSLGNAYGMSMWDFQVYATALSGGQTSLRELGEGVTVSAGRGSLSIFGADGQMVEVYSLRGSLVFASNDGERQRSVSLPGGAYVVRVGGVGKLVTVR